MQYIITGRNLDITEGLRAAVMEKIGKLERYFSPATEVQVTLSVEKDRQKIEVTIPVKGSIIRSEQVSNDMYVSIDLVEEIIERQLKKYKTKLTDQAQSAQSFSEAYLEEESEEPEAIVIKRTKRFAVKPMDPEEAYMRLADILSLLASEWLPYFPPQKEVKPKDITLAQSESGELEVPEEMVAFEPDLLMNETFLREQRMEAICGVWTDFDPLNCKLEPSRAPRRTRK